MERVLQNSSISRSVWSMLKNLTTVSLFIVSFIANMSSHSSDLSHMARMENTSGDSYVALSHRSTLPDLVHFTLSQFLPQKIPISLFFTVMYDPVRVLHAFKTTFWSLSGKIRECSTYFLSIKIIAIQRKRITPSNLWIVQYTSGTLTYFLMIWNCCHMLKFSRPYIGSTLYNYWIEDI